MNSEPAAPAESDDVTAPVTKPATSAFPAWLRQLLPGIVILLASARILAPVADPDTFWHLAAGKYLTETWQFNGKDPWSPESSQPWRLHEWLPELGMHGAYQIGGIPAVAWLLALASVLILVTLWIVLRRRASLLVTTIAMLIAFIGMTNSFTLRPHLVTFGLCVVVSGAWLATRQDGRARWWLIPLSWLWACSHGMWFVGPIIGLVALLGMLLDRAATPRQTLRLATIPVGSIVIAALTPVGPELLLSPFQVSETTHLIREWQPPSLHYAGFDALLVLAGVTLLVWSRSPRTADWTSLLLVGLGVGLALQYVRTVPLGAAIIAPVAAATWHSASGLVREKISRREVVMTSLLAVATLTVTALMAPATAPRAKSGADDLSAALSAIPQGTVICNDYALGGWLIWAHPNVRPAIDGRVEIYDPKYVVSAVDYAAGVPGWEAYPRKVGCPYALVDNKTAPASNLVKQEHWSVVQRGKKYSLLKAPKA